MDRFTLYARSEPTSEKAQPHAPPSSIAGKRDVVIYKDEAATERVGRYPWYYDSKPRKSDKTITHNCFRYALVWLPPKVD